MPRLNDIDMEQHQLTGSYGYSAIGLNKLGASEYTLATLICDVSSSVSRYRDGLEHMFQAVVEALANPRNPRVDNLLLRAITFADNVSEVHGFKLISECKPSDYQNILTCGGMTALFDATENGIDAEVDFGLTLTQQDYAVNGAVYIITDGGNNRGASSPAGVVRALNRVYSEEALESIVSVLIGLNTTPELNQYLEAFQRDAGLTHYKGFKEVTPQVLRDLTGLMSTSISSQSQALGTGQPSQTLNF
jgi:hypothetical protein